MQSKFFEFNVFTGSMRECTDLLLEAINSEARECRLLACINPHSYVTAEEDASFSAALQGADWLIPDGIGIVLAARFIGLPIKERVSGPDVFEALMFRLNESGGSVFFFGSSEGTLTRIREQMIASYPNVKISGTLAPPFKEEFSREESHSMIRVINEAKPDVLWVGLTAPKQEKWLHAYRGELDVKVAGAIGAAFDFFAETTKRAPLIIRRFGLEWLHRSLKSPARLGKRNASSNPKFLLSVIRLGLSKYYKRYPGRD